MMCLIGKQICRSTVQSAGSSFPTAFFKCKKKLVALLNRIECKFNSSCLDWHLLRINLLQCSQIVRGNLRDNYEIFFLRPSSTYIQTARGGVPIWQCNWCQLGLINSHPMLCNSSIMEFWTTLYSYGLCLVTRANKDKWTSSRWYIQNIKFHPKYNVRKAGKIWQASFHEDGRNQIETCTSK